MIYLSNYIVCLDIVNKNIIRTHQ